MRSKRPLVSVVIVNYRADEYVQKIQKSLGKDTNIECIVIDNSDGQRGYGAGCNQGAQQAKGEMVLFANPDLEITPDCVWKLHDFLDNHPQVGLVGPQIRSPEGAVEITCSTIPTAGEAAILFSWLHRLPVFRRLTHHYRLQGFDHQTSRPVPAVSGACFMMRREDFLDIGGCDENLFLYFEEFDLALRVRQQLEKQVYFLASCSLIHFGQKSTEQSPTAQQHFRRSRRSWLQKHFGLAGRLATWWLELGEMLT